jgi:hypothetical protein
MDLQILLDDFNFYRTHTNHFQKLRTEHPGIKLSKMNKQREQLLAEMVAWCRSQDLDPRYWLFCLFVRGRWLFAPKWTPGFFMSKNALAWNRAKSGKTSDRLYRERLAHTQDIQRAQQGTTLEFNPDIHLSAEAEARKQKYQRLGEMLLCLDNIQDPQYPTLGWHPASKFCELCVSREQCKEKLRALYRYDVVALREGKITLFQANLTKVTNGRS